LRADELYTLRRRDRKDDDGEAVYEHAFVVADRGATRRVFTASPR
jgi:hypothetical protein